MGRLIPDMVSLIFVTLVHGLSLLPVVFLGEGIWRSSSLFLRCIALPLLTLLFLAAYCIVNALARRALIGRLPSGDFIFGRDWAASRWRFSMIFSVTSGNMFYSNIHYFTFLKYLFFKTAGARVAYDNLLAVDAHIHEPDLVEIGVRCVVGRQAIIAAHLVPRSREQLKLAPVVIGDDCIVGACSLILCGSKIGNGVLVGANSTVGVGAEVGDNAVILPNSYVKSRQCIPPGQTWGGTPARCISEHRT